MTTEEFKRIIFDLEGENYKLVSEYIDNKTKVTMVHNNCEQEFEILANNFIKKGKRCSNPKCSKITNKYNFKDRVFNKYGDEYLVLDDYIDSATEIRFKHNVDNCGKTFFRKPKYLLTGKSLCTFCQRATSRGEGIIEKILKNNNIGFVREFTFDSCKDIKILRFDFAIFDEFGQLNYLIEYDGRHHFEPVDFSGKRGREWAVEELSKLKERDLIKNTFCKNNHISLYRIPYWELDKGNIEQLINKLIQNEYIKIDETSFLVV